MRALPAAALLLALAAGPALATHGPGGLADITAAAFTFLPTGPAPVAPGALVAARNAEPFVPHTVTSGALPGGDGAFDTGVLAAGATATFAAPALPGAYPYFCAIHPWMRGVLVVQEPPS